MLSHRGIFSFFGQRPQRGRSPVEHRRTVVRPFVRPFVRLSPPGPLRPEICPFRPEIYPLRPEICLSGLESALSGLKSALPGLKSVLLGLKSALTDSRPERADFRSERVNFRPERADFRPERAWGERTDGWTDGRNDERKSPCVLQDFVPFGAAALLPLTPFHNHAKQGNGYR